VLDDIAVPTGGRPRSRPQVLIADKAYSHPCTRTGPAQMAYPHRHPRTLRPAGTPRHPRQPRRTAPAFDAEAYKGRNVVERAFGRLKQWRGIATRYDKHARNYRAGIVLGDIVLFWLR
jgi:transposase